MRCSRLRAARERQAQFAIALEAATNTAILARTQYRAGLTDFQQLLEAERSLLSARDGLAGSRGDEALALVQLYRALGGGWDPTAAARYRKNRMNDQTRTTPVSNEATPDKDRLEDFLGAPAAKPWYKRPLYLVGLAVLVVAPAAAVALLHRHGRGRLCDRDGAARQPHRHRLRDRQPAADQRGPGRLRAIGPGHPGVRRQ